MLLLQRPLGKRYAAASLQESKMINVGTVLYSGALAQYWTN